MKKMLYCVLFAPLFSLSQSHPRTLKPASLPSIQDANEVRPPFRENKIFYEKIDSSIQMTKDQLFDAAKLWFADAFVAANFVIQAQERESGELVGKGIYSYKITYGGVVMPQIAQFTIRISCRNNKFRIQIYDIGNRIDEVGSSFHAIELYYIARKDGFNESIVRTVDDKMTDILFSARKSIQRKDGF